MKTTVVGPGALVLALLLAARGAAPQPPPEPEQHLFPITASLVLEGEVSTLPATLTPTLPLFPLGPLAARLGQRVETGAFGEKYSFRLLGREVVIGAQSPAVTILGGPGEEAREPRVIPLSHPAVLGPGGLEVPLDFFEQTFGDLLGYQFAWDPAARVLTVSRRAPKVLSVVADAVHLQGTTTLVLTFPERPRYRIVERPGAMEVEIVEDSLRPAAGQPPLKVELVRRFEVAKNRIRIQFAPDAAVESYSLDNPFRLVFDIHPRTAAAVTETVPVAPPRPPAGIRTVVLDPGHGGEETGAIGKSGTAEKNLTLLLAQALKSRLESRLPLRVVLTRSEDLHLPLEARTAIANQRKADLFLSLHINSAHGGAAHGAETYFLSMEASDRLAARTAEEENLGGGPRAAAGGEDPLHDLQLILWDLAQSHHLEESQRLAALIQEELNLTLDLRNRGVKQAPFRVLMGAAMPAVLVELGFLSNPEEEVKLNDPAYRNQLVEALYRAIARYRAQAETATAARDALP